MSTAKEKYSRIFHDCVQDRRWLVSVFTTKTQSRVLCRMMEESFLLRSDWKKVNAVTSSFGEELPPKICKN